MGQEAWGPRYFEVFYIPVWMSQMPRHASVSPSEKTKEAMGQIYPGQKLLNTVV